MALSPDEVKAMYKRLSPTQEDIDVIMYDKIIQTKDLANLIGKKAIIFYPAMNYGNITMGHYIALLFGDPTNQLMFYDPLAYKPDEYKKFTNRRLYRERTNTLVEHLLKHQREGYTIDYNNHQHQSRKSSVETCGRHCIIRCLLSDYNNANYNRILKQLDHARAIPTGKLRDSLIEELTQ